MIGDEMDEGCLSDDTIIIIDLQVEMSVKCALPNIDRSKVQKVLKKLKDLGVENTCDLALVEPTDLGMLTAIESRKATQEWKKAVSG